MRDLHVTFCPRLSSAHMDRRSCLMGLSGESPFFWGGVRLVNFERQRAKLGASRLFWGGFALGSSSKIFSNEKSSFNALIFRLNTLNSKLQNSHAFWGGSSSKIFSNGKSSFNTLTPFGGNLKGVRVLTLQNSSRHREFAISFIGCWCCWISSFSNQSPTMHST